MAVTDNYIGTGMYEMICADINLPKYIRKEKRVLTKEEKNAMASADFTDREKDKSPVSITKALIFDGNASEIKSMPKSDNGFRTVPVPGSAAFFLKEYISKTNGPQLFTCRSGALITHSSYVKMWNSVVKKMNHAAGGTEMFPVITGLTAHIFRHNYCSNLCYKVPEISIKKIAQLMGNTEKVVIDVYNHIIDEKEDVSEVVESALAM